MQRLETGFTIMKTKDNEKAPHLLDYIGEEAFNTVCDNCVEDVASLS